MEYKIDDCNPPISKAGIYVIKNLFNGKQYIGISVNISRRIREHFRMDGSAPILSKAIKKYGASSFLVTPIYYSIGGTEHLPELESDFIEMYRSADTGYNIQRASGSVGPYGEQFSAILRASLSNPESKTRRSNAQKAAKGTPEARSAQSIRSKEISARPGTKEKRSEALKRAFNHPEKRDSMSARILAMQTPEFVAARIEKMRQTMKTQESKDKRSKASIAMQSKELNDKKSASLKRTMGTPEFKAKRSAASLAMQSPELNRKKSESLKSAYQDPSYKEKIAASKRGRVWITDGSANRSIYPSDAMPDGWLRGKCRRTID